MITEDYILRLIRQAAEFVAKALGLAREGDFLTSEAAMENGLKDLTGLSVDTLKNLDASALRAMTGGDDASVFVLAEFLRGLAEVERVKGMLDQYFLYLKKALDLLINIRVNEDIDTESPIVEVYEKVRNVIYEKELIEELLEFFRERGNSEECGYLMHLMENGTD